MFKRLSAAVLFLFFGGVFAQVVAPSAGEEARLTVAVSMVGLKYTVTLGGQGSEHSPTAPALVWSLVGDTFSAALDTVHPCDFLHAVFWIENTGGITLDFNIWDNEVSTDWVKNPTATNGCAALVEPAPPFGENSYGSCYSFEASDGVPATPDSGFVGWVAAPVGGVGSEDEFEGLWAQDPNDTSDGVWSVQLDQRELHIGILAPYTSSTTAPQTIDLSLTGKVTD